MSISVEQFVERLTQSGLMSAQEIESFQQQLPPRERPKDVQQLAQALVQQGKLTKYQAQAVYQGKTKGLVFGQYVVLDKLGEGGMGVVLKAQHRRMERLVAIKVLSSAAMKLSGAVERFHREVEAAAKLSHPNIVTAYDAGEQQGMHYLVTEYVEGRDLAAIIEEKGPLPVTQAVACIVQAARGLQYAHEQGIVHRDIKPSNLLLDKKGTVKILDMGLARIVGPEAVLGGPHRLTVSGQVMGTCDYMAPEQAIDSHAVDHRADIYALGCTLYQLLTGQPPYRGDSLMQVLVAHQQACIPSLRQARPEVPEELDAIFQKMVAKRPEDRPRSMAEVVEALDPLAQRSDSPAPLGRAEGSLPSPIAPPPVAARARGGFSTSLALVLEQFVLRRRGDGPGPSRRAWTSRVTLITAGAAAAVVLAVALVLWGLAVSPEGSHTILPPEPGQRTVRLTPPSFEPVTQEGVVSGEKGRVVAPDWKEPQALRPPPQHVAEVKPKLAPAPKPAPKPEPRPEPKPEPKVAQKAAEKPTGKPAVKPDAVAPQGSQAAAHGKQPVPEGASLEKALKLARESFKEDYAKAKTAAQKIDIAANLRKTARQGTPEPAERFVLLQLARDIAVQAGDVTAAFAAIDEMAQTFVIDTLAMKSEMLAGLADKAGADGRAELADAAIELISKAIEAENFDAAKEPARVADILAGKVHDRDLTQRVRAVQKELADNVRAAEAVQAARETLKDRPADRDANLALGQYQCFVRNQWKEGLKRLAAGADEELKTVAQRDIDSRQANRDESVELADAWWNLSRKAGGKNREGMTLRAGAWYRQATEEGLSAGMLRTRVEKRLAEVEKLGREIRELPAGPPPAKAPFDAKRAQSLQARWARHLKIPLVQTNSIGMKLVLIPPGEFQMGSPKELIAEEVKAHGNDPWFLLRAVPGEGPQHHVRITRPFCLGVYEVTQAEYQQVMGKNPSEFSATGQYKVNVFGQDTKRFPVENVSWNDAVEFCRKLSEMPEEKAAGRTYRLPSEAQWEYACRAGSTGRYCFSVTRSGIAREQEDRDLSNYGWFADNAGGRTHPVGQKRANAWGLYDMHGNVSELCLEGYDEDFYASSVTDDPVGPPGGSSRVIRGHDWGGHAWTCRSAVRGGVPPGLRSFNIGFRASLVLAEK